MGFEQAGHRFGPRPRFGRRMRTGHDVRSDHRCRQRKVWEPEVRFSHLGPVMVMPWIIGLKRARELLFFGDMIDAPTALQFGMVNRVVPAAELRERTMKYAKRLGLVSPEALQWGKRADQPRCRSRRLPGCARDRRGFIRFALQHQDRRRKGVRPHRGRQRDSKQRSNGAPRSSKSDSKHGAEGSTPLCGWVPNRWAGSRLTSWPCSLTATPGPSGT